MTSTETIDASCNIEYGTRVVQKRDGGSQYPVYGGGGPTFALDRYNRKDRVVIARFGMSPQCTRFVSGTFFLNDSGLTISPKRGNLDIRFLDYQVLFLNDRIYALGKGSAQKNLDVSAFRALPIFVPSIPKQHRIVAILDETFGGITIARANAETNLASSRELFESEQESILANRCEGWISAPLRAVTSKIGSGATPLGGAKAYQKSGTALIRSLNVHDGEFRRGRLAFINDQQAKRLANVEVQGGDVLLNITGASVARCCVVPNDILPARVNQHVSIIRPLSNQIDSEFLQYLLTSRTYKSRLLGIGAEGGATRQAITKAQIQEFAISFPKPTREQRAIAARLTEMGDETRHLLSVTERKLAALDDLRMSLLQRAFNGEL